MMTEKTKKKNKLYLRDIIFMPLGCLLQSSPVIVILIGLIIFFASDYIYYNLNVDLPGFQAPSINTWSISEGYDQFVDQKGYKWSISFEKNNNSTFEGLIRHVSPIRENKFPMLSHDILVTSGDFANPAKIKTSVSNHSFVYKYDRNNPPVGKINLLHAVPLNDEIHKQLLAIRYGDLVKISGREIYEIIYIDKDLNRLNFNWKDSGCNTLLVTSVEVITNPN
jgi:hypothetical protein